MALARGLSPALMLLAACLVWCGCSTRVKVMDAAPDFAADLAASRLVALGGVTVAPTVGGALAPADELDAAEAFYRAFLGSRPDLIPWPVELVGEQVGAASLQALVGEYGRLGRLRPDQVQPLLAELDGCRFLALARLTEDAIESRSLSRDGFDPVRGDPEAEQTSPWSMTVSTERTVKVTLEIFDLRSGRSVWRAQASARDLERYQYEDRLRRDPNRYLQERLAAGDGPAYLDRRGEYLKLPDLIDLIEQALAGLVLRLPAGPRS